MRRCNDVKVDFDVSIKAEPTHHRIAVEHKKCFAMEAKFYVKTCKLKSFNRDQSVKYFYQSRTKSIKSMLSVFKKKIFSKLFDLQVFEN